MTHNLSENKTIIETEQYHIEVELDNELIFNKWCRIQIKENNTVVIFSAGLDRIKKIKSIKNK